MKKLLSILVSFLLVIFFSGCTSVVQLKEKLILQGIGIDKSEEKYMVTVQALSIKGENDKESELSSGNKVQIFKACGYSTQDAMVNLRIQTGQDTLYWHTLLLVIGEEIAKDGVEEIMDFFIKNSAFNPNAEVLIAHGTAFDILTTKTNDTILNSEKIVSILKQGLDNSKRFNTNLKSVVSDLKGEYIGASVGYINSEELKGDNALIVNKIAFFNGNKLAQVLDEEETKGFFFIKGKGMRIYDILYSDEYKNITYTVTNSKSKVKCFLQDSKIVVLIDMKVNLYISQSDVYMYRINDFSDIEFLFEERIKDLARKAIKKSITDNQTDIFGFSRKFMKTNTQYSQTEPCKIIEMLQNAEYKVNVKATLTSAKP